MTARRWLAGLLATVATLAGAGCSGGAGEWRNSCATNADRVVECAPDQRPEPTRLTGELLHGGDYDLTRDRGNVVVVNFWGSWCAPCRAEADDLEGTYQATRGSGVRFLGVNVQDDRDKAKAFEQGRATYPSIYDPGSRAALSFRIPPVSTPATFVLDREGRIAAVVQGAVRREVLQPVVERVAAEQPAAR